MDRSTLIKLIVAIVAFCGLFLGLATVGVFVLDRLITPEETGQPESHFPSESETEKSADRPRPPPPEWEPPLPPPSPQMEEWIALLGSPDHSKRVDASRRLVALGSTAVPALEQALTHTDPEVRWRAKEALRRIREKR